jgi:hypothetical protein
MTDFHEAIHTAMIHAADEPRTENNFIVSSFKVKQDELEAVKAICENNDATVSAFIRQIFKQLILDYVPDYGSRRG